MSSNLRVACAAIGAGKRVPFFSCDWKAERWNLMVVLGAAIGGFIGSNYLSDATAVEINPEIAQKLSEKYDISSAGEAYLPTEIFATENILQPFNNYINCGRLFSSFWSQICRRLHLWACYLWVKQFTTAIAYSGDRLLYRRSNNGTLYLSFNFLENEIYHICSDRNIFWDRHAQVRSGFLVSYLRNV